MTEARFVGVAGLPRSGSTLLCQLLAEHPDICSDGHSSPLCATLGRLRHGISDDSFFLSQMDVDFERSYQRLARAMRAFLRAWHHDCEKAVIVDKSRGWLNNFEMLLHIEPEARLLICVRELGQICASVEAQHQRTILIDFPDHLAKHDRYARADALFSKDGVIGGPLRALQSVQDLAPEIQQRIHMVGFERLMSDPVATMAEVHAWLGVSAHRFDPASLTVRPHESDSHYRFKYRHPQHGTVSPPQIHAVPRRIQSELEHSYSWFYDHFYPHWKRLQPGP